MSEVQSVVFSKNLWTITQAKAWLKSHKMRYGKVDKKIKTLRFRQSDPSNFKYFRMKKITDGLSFVVGFNKKVRKIF